MKKRILASILTICILFVLCGSTLSEAHNNVAIAYLEDANIANGDGVSFHADRLITVREWYAMLCRADGYVVKEPWEQAVGKYLDYAYSNYWIDYNTYSEPLSKVTLSAACEGVFALLDIEVYDGDDKYVALAQKNGLVDDYPDSNHLITRGEAAELLYRALTRDIRPYPPDIVNYIHICCDGSSPPNSVVVELEKIPTAILDKFNQDGWVFYYGSKYMKDIFPQYASYANGVTSDTRRIIVVDGAESILHEFGHFLHIELNQDAELRKIYNDDYYDITFSNAHYKSTEFEYFSECFADYINGEYIPDNLSIWSYLSNLEKIGWIKK